MNTYRLTVVRDDPYNERLATEEHLLQDTGYPAATVGDGLIRWYVRGTGVCYSLAHLVSWKMTTVPDGE